MLESVTQARIRAALGAIPRVLVQRRHVGVFLAVPGRIGRAIDVLRAAGIASSAVRIGHVGEADLQGFVGGQVCASCGAAAHPAPFALEIKSDTGRQTDEQQAWAVHVWGRRGGRYAVVRGVDEALQALGLDPGEGVH